MKKIYKLIKDIGGYYRDYDLHVTKNHIEVKFSPKNRIREVDLNHKEHVFVTTLNSSEDLVDFQMNLLNHLRDLEQGSSVRVI